MLAADMNPNEVREAKHIARLIIGYLNNSLLPEEKKELDEWITASAENRELFEKLSDENHPNDSVEWFTEIDKKTGSEKEQPHISNPAIVKRLTVAASAILVIGLAGWLFFHSRSNSLKKENDNAITRDNVLPGSFKATLTTESGDRIVLGDSVRDIHTNGTLLAKQEGYELVYPGNTDNSFNILSVPANGLYKVKLSDGTIIWLNSASVLRYPTSFNNQSERRVELSGEAYFEIAAEKSLPFRVIAGKTLIEVLGTTFNVKSYADEPHQYVTLLQGNVNIITDKKIIKLNPGDEGTITNGRALQVIREDDAEEKISWTKGLFSFKKASIEDILRTLSRWYNIKIVYETRPDRQFTGNIPMKSDIQTALQMLELSGQVHLILSGRTVTVRP